MTALAGFPTDVLPAAEPARSGRSGLLLGGITVAVAASSISPLAAGTAAIPAVLVLLGEATGRRPVSLAGILVSTLFVAQVPAGIREPLLVAAGAVGGMLVRQVTSGLRISVHRALPPLLLLLAVALDQVFRPAMTTAGQFAVFEQCVLLLTMIAMLVGGYRRSSDPRAAESALHLALVVTALVAGADSLRALSVASAEDIANRQVSSVFGASNYLASLLALAVVACVHRMCSRTGRVWPNLVATVALVVMLLPQASRTSSSIGVAVAFWLLIRHRRWGWLITALVGVAAVLVLTPSISVLQRFQSGQSSGDELNGRVELWKFALKVIGNNPVFGVGSGRVADALHDAWYIPTYVHDVWLSLIAQFGLLGIGFLVIGVWWLVTAPLGHYARLLAVTALLLSTTEPVVETLKMGLVFTAVIGLGAVHVMARSAPAHRERA